MSQHLDREARVQKTGSKYSQAFAPRISVTVHPFDVMRSLIGK
jgi:hypothetical protein